jgi:hypothetical protein
MRRHVRFELSRSSRFQSYQSLLILILPGLLLLSGCAGVVSTPVHAGGSGPTALSISASALPSGQAKSAYSSSLAVTGGTAPYVWSVSSGSLPVGLSMSGSGQISGTPTTPGTSSFTVSVTDSSSPVESASANLSITITAAATAVQITTSSLAGGQTNTAYSATLAATGGTSPYTWSVSSGSLPAGLTLSSAGQISGTPGTAGTSSFTVSVSDSSSPAQSATANLSIAISASVAALQITTSSLPGGVAKTAYSATEAATGGKTPYSWSVSSGSLPAGLTLSSAGQISGTPTTSGTYSFTVQVTDSSSPAQKATKSHKIPIAASGTPLQITTTSLPSGATGTSYSTTLAATGGKTAYSWSVSSGSLPTGLTLSSSGQISGTPTATGTFSFIVNLTDSSSPAQSITANLSITISAPVTPVQITTTSLAGGQTGASYSTSLAASGGKTPYSWSVSSGSLPTGLSLSSAGQISGTPTSAGTFSFTVKVTDASSPAQSATANLSITITVAVATLQITTSALPAGQMNASYSATLAATGGKTPYSWSVTGGSLPTGLSLSATTGVISGTTADSGVFSLTFQVKDASSPAQAATSPLELSVNDPSSTNCPTGQPCGASAAYCSAYSSPSTSGATDVLTLPVGYGGAFLITTPGNYYLSGDVSKAKSGIAVLTTSGSVDINLNGHTLTYGTTADGSGASQIGEYGILMCNTGNLSAEMVGSSYGSNGLCLNGGMSAGNVTIENGTITQSPNASQYYDPANCPGSGVNSGSGGACANPHDTIASHAIYAAYNSGLTVKHVTINIQDTDSRGIVYHWQQSGPGMDVECNTINDKVTRLNARDEAYGAIWSGNQSGGTKANLIQYNTILGSPQGGIVLGAGGTEVPGTTVQFNDINQGFYQGPPYTSQLEMYSNDYALGVCIPAGSVQYNYIHSVNGRGIGCIFGGDQNNESINNNYVNTGELAVNGEYGPNGTINGGGWSGGCEIDGGRGFESKSSPAIQIFSNTLIANVSQCGAGGIVFTEFPCTEISCPSTASHAFNIHDNTIQILNTTGSNLLTTPQDAACYVLDTSQGNYSNYFSPILRDSCTTDGDYVTTDGYNPADYFTFINPTYAAGSHPLAAGCGGSSGSNCGHMMHWQGQQGPPSDERGFVFQDVVTGGGTTASFAGDGGTPTARSATVKWTYTVTVQSSATSAGVSGATVSATDGGGNHTSCVTGSNGVCSLTLNQESVSSPSGSASLTTTSLNPNSLSISATGCTTLNYGVAIAGTTSETRALTCQ